MTRLMNNHHPTKESLEGIREFLYFSGLRFWTASFLPALVGTTLPFWLNPPGFNFRWISAIEFLFATVLFHAGFSFLHAWFEKRSTGRWPGSKLLGFSFAGIILAILLGLHINSELQLNKFVFRNIFIFYGIAAIVIGLLYVAPPARLCRRIGGEIVVAEGLGMIPVLGAYLVQAGDLTRTVYLASLPLAAATGLWIWMDEIISVKDDEETGRRTLVIDFGLRFSGRFGVLAIAILIYVTIIMAVLSGALSPLSLMALLSGILAWKIVVVSWNGYLQIDRIIAVRKNAFLIHMIICIIIAVSSLLIQRI